MNAEVHLNANGSLLLDGAAADLVGLGSTLEEHGITVVYIGADTDATVGALVDLMQELAAHRIKGVLSTKP